MNRHRYPSKGTLAKDPDFPLSVQKTILAMGLNMPGAFNTLDKMERVSEQVFFF